MPPIRRVAFHLRSESPWSTSYMQSNDFVIRIQNPLVHMSEEECLADVNGFAKEHGFEDIHPLLVKGALISRDPTNFATVPGITEDEKIAIANETLRKWHQPRVLYFTIILCSIGAAVQGW